jgi:hydrogenase maturation protease
MFNVLVIGYGNPLRGDDAVGQIVVGAVEQWRIPKVKALALHQLAPELAEDLARASTVFFVDASVDVRLEHPVVQDIQATESVGHSSHHSSPTELLALTKHLYGCVPRACLIEMPAEDFGLREEGLREELSSKAQAGVKEVLEFLYEALGVRLVSNDVAVLEEQLPHIC